jgi:putative ABC transport system permease protein
VLALGPALPHPDAVTVNARVVSLALAAGILSALLFTLVPILRLRTLQPSALFRGRTTSGRMAWNRAHVGVAGQVALTTVLLVSGGLSVRTLSALNGVEVGFDPLGVVTTRVALPAWDYQDPEAINRFYTQVHGRVETSPGVESVSAGRGLPFSTLGQAFNSVQRMADDGEAIRFDTRRTNVLPQYFETLGIPVRRGRGFTWQDELGAREVAIISESLARREWPDGDALDRAISFRGREYAVIGVVGDVRSTNLTGDVEPVLYLPALQYMEGDMYILARATTDPLAVLRQVRSAILEVDPSAAIIQETSLLSFMNDSIRDDRFRTLLMVMFGASALLLSAVGLGGTVARLVTQRTREWGVRSALGASPRGLMAHIVLRSLTPAALGVIAGLALALAAGRFMRPFLYGVQTWDPTTLGIVAVGLVAICVVAAALPARRAAHMHPSRALSEE